MKLDLHTMSVVMFALKILQVPLLAYVWRVHRNYPPARLWAYSAGFMGIAYLLAGLGAIFVCNLFMILGEIALDTGIAQAAGRRLPPRLMALAFTVQCFGNAYFLFVVPSAPHRIEVYTLATLLCRCYSIWACLAYGRRRLSRSLRALALLQAIVVLANLWRAGNASSVPDVFVATDAQVCWALVSLSATLALNVLLILLASHSVQEELAVARAQAEEANQAKSNFLSTMSQELRTPLNEILAHAHPDGGSEMGTIRRCGEHLLSLIDDLLDLGEGEALLHEDFHLPALLDDLVSLLGTRAQEKGLFLQLDSDVPWDRVRGDARRLRQVLLNLVGNAVKFSDSGSVRLEVRQCGERITFRVRDQGPGLSPEALQNLFTPFSQFGADHKKSEGSGLGLAISQRLVQRLGGELQVESKLGQGSLFWFALLLPTCEARKVLMLC